jgi:hypothetical protein
LSESALGCGKRGQIVASGIHAPVRSARACPRGVIRKHAWNKRLAQTV